MDGSRGRFGHDGTQPPPPPHVYPDPLAGLVTGEQPYRAPEAVVPVVTPPPAPVPVDVPSPRAAVRRQAEPRSRPVRAPAQHVTGQPAEHAPHAGLARRQPPPAPGWQPPAPQAPKKSRGGLIGCLVVLAALSGLLFNVLREIIEAVVDLVR